MKLPRPARPGRAALVALTAAAFAFATYAAITGRGGVATEVVIEIEPTTEGLFLIQEKDIERRLDDGPYGTLIGKSIAGFDLESLEAYLEQDPFIAEAEVYTRYGGAMRVALRQHEPILRVHHRGGADYYVSPDGAVLPLSKHGVARVPVLTGQVAAFESAAADSLPPAVYPLAVALARDPLLRPLIEQIDLHDGEYTLIPKLGTAQFVLGDLRDLDAKLRRLRAFVDGVYPERGWDYYQRVDLRYEGLAFGTKPGA